MTPLTHTLYAVTLFLALIALRLWAKRRRRASHKFRRAIADMSDD